MNSASLLGTEVSLNVFPWTIRPLDETSLGIRPLDDVSYRCVPGSLVVHRHPENPNLLLVAVVQGWANLDQAHEDLDRNIFRDLSPTPKP
jgi:hypothetical protein